MAAIYAAEQIENCPVIGHLDGAYYAFLMANNMPEKIQKLRIINGAVPIREVRQINEASPRQRVTAYTAYYAPKLLPFILRTGINHIRKDGIDNMMQALFKQSEADYALLNDPEIGDIMIHGFESCIANGIQSITNDMRCIIANDWTDLIKNCSVPTELFHSTEEHIVPIRQVYDLVKLCPHLKLTTLTGGQLILYKNPEILFADL